jgi:CSLREA domain-containing protein
MGGTMKNTYFLRLSITVLTVIFLFLGAAGTVSAANFTVTKIADTNDGVCNSDCSLREAVAAANSVGSNDTIDFAPALSGQTITLSNALPDILVVNAGSLAINGLGANKLTIDGGTGTTRIFTVNSAVFSLSGVTLSGGNGSSAFLFTGDGGAVAVSGGTATFDGVHFTNNTGASLGGAIYFSGGANHVIRNSTFSANSAANFGAVMADSSAPLTITNSTFSGNSTTGAGGAIGVVNGSSAILRNDTIASNTASSGGGIFVQGGTLNFGNTIIAGNNGAFPEILFVAGTVVSAGNNLVGDSAGDSLNTSTPIAYMASDVQNVSPQLLALGNYGGPTPTRALQFSSPARNNGSDGLASAAGLVYDQRGPSFLRFIGTVDMGAFEVQDPRFYVTKTTDSNDGACNDDCSLREAVAAAPNGGIVDFSRALSGQTVVLTGGEIVLNKIVTIDGFGANLIEISGNNTSRIFTINGVDVKITGVKLSGGNGGGTSSGFGGAVLVNGGNLNLDAADISNNTAAITSGGVFIAGSTNSRIGYSTVSFNSASGCAGVDTFNSTVYIVNSTFSDNNAANVGGGLCLSGTGTSITSRNVTISDNSAGTGGGVVVNPGNTFNFGNTIIARNFAVNFPEIANAGSATSAGNNLVGDSVGDAQNTSTAITYQGSDILNTPPILGPLTIANGGTTPTRQLGPISPAIDKGSNALAVDQGNVPLIVDQRGFTRIVDGNGDSVAVVDIGAYEFAALAPTAANVSISGYVLNGKSGIARARVTMTDSQGNIRAVTTNSFGRYSFDEVTAGETYIFQVSAKGYQFSPQIVTVNEELAELNFTPEE